MIHVTRFKPSRRAILAWATLAAMSTTTPHAQELDDPEPADLLPRRISVEKFNNLSDNELYKYNLAIRHGRTILIGDNSPSESRRLISEAARSRK